MTGRETGIDEMIITEFWPPKHSGNAFREFCNLLMILSCGSCIGISCPVFGVLSFGGV